jgi:hypothetical protein
MNPSQALAITSATLFIGASTAIGAVFGYQLGAKYGPEFGFILATAAVAGELAKPLAVHATFTALGRFHLGRVLGCGILAIVCVVYSLAADLGLSATMRGDAAASRANQGVASQDARVKRDRAIAELAQVAPARSAGELAPALSAKVSALRGEPCGPDASKPARAICADLATLEAEAARSVRRDKLQAAVDAADKAVAVAGDAGVVQADPLASTVAALAGMLGRPMTVDALTPWLALLLPVLVEVGSSLGLVLVAATSPTPGTPAQSQLPRLAVALDGDLKAVEGVVTIPVRAPVAAPTKALAVAVQTDVHRAPKRKPKSKRKAAPRIAKAAIETRVLDTIKADGKAPASVRGLAALLGAPKSSVHVALGSLIASGMIERCGDVLTLRGHA